MTEKKPELKVKFFDDIKFETDESRMSGEFLIGEKTVGTFNVEVNEKDADIIMMNVMQYLTKISSYRFDDMNLITLPVKMLKDLLNIAQRIYKANTDKIEEPVNSILMNLLNELSAQIDVYEKEKDFFLTAGDQRGGEKKE